MALISVYRGDTKSLSLNFTQDDGVTPLNVSGYSIFFGASQSYSSSPIIYIGTTGNNAAAVTGLVTITLSSGDTNICPSDYLADFRAVSPSGVVSTYPTAGLRILPTVLPV